MTAPNARLTAREYAFFGLGLLFWAGFVILLGKDTSWDFRNYHWYGPYALLHHRMAMDVAVAHQASYYNPYLDVPFQLPGSACEGQVAGYHNRYFQPVGLDGKVVLPAGEAQMHVPLATVDASRDGHRCCFTVAEAVLLPRQ